MKGPGQTVGGYKQPHCRIRCEDEETLGTCSHSVQFTGASLGEEGLKIHRHNNTTKVSAVVPVTEVLAKKQAPSSSPGSGNMVLLGIARL